MCWLKNLFGGVSQQPSVPSGTRLKKALLVGTNKYAMKGNDLNGCVADAEDMYDLLVNGYGFLADNVRVLTDDRATKANVVERLNWLVTGTDLMECVYYNSSHGTKLRVRKDGTLKDSIDEAIVTYDFDWDDRNTQLIDDDIHGIISLLNAQSRLAVIVDSCHSGSILGDKDFGKRAKFIVPPFDIRARMINRQLKLNKIGHRAVKEFENHILLSGCNDDQTSAETLFGNQTRGALTFNFTKRVRKGPEACWMLVQKDVCRDMKSQGFDQDPQLKGSIEIQNRLVFGGK
jgi:hypothetical protein